MEVAPEDTRGGYRINGKPAVGLGILRQSTANTLSVAVTDRYADRWFPLTYLDMCR